MAYYTFQTILAIKNYTFQSFLSPQNYTFQMNPQNKRVKKCRTCHIGDRCDTLEGGGGTPLER